jgi:cytochrome b561
MDTVPSRYDRVAIALHWLIGAALLGQIAFGFALDEIAPRNTPARSAVINLHKSIGIVLGLLIAARLLWRLAHHPPPWPSGLASWQRRAAVVTHRMLYACMLVMPLSGYVGSNFSRHGLKFFGTPWAPWGPDLPAVYAFFSTLHIATAFVFTALIALHIAAALRHALVERDDVMQRMWPRRPAAHRGSAHRAPSTETT